ncbi:MAG TPA: 50S ribosomal protein L18 [Gammaproteobacteria bacterium]|jgi:large subunit ribosomal protein L18|nr:50S ribosomal protein L18 [Acidiferrobacteraceae bacterium]MDP6399237.1 50S ribosomal protein L18 [Arenicellales bacterium]HCX86734.1 50S ribosomal protein L18 [Gammaproteobacteria bacterium]MDP6551072.1 50S ribosomal protein L18 [Arenicellales bacterium]MDP6790894.1 50S ribosomal protein L18 [Arenicellales bacterium]|tara:strand:+ start:769 stop:1125 length:357 start_codon:yes stop_codon:yes gene_type:complete
MSEKKTSRIRRGVRTRSRISRDRVNRMSIFRTPRHIYAQIIDPSGGRVLASASSLEAEVRADLKHGSNIAAAAVVGKRIAEKAIAAGVDNVAFDRSGFRYHGRVKALAEAAREGGLKF